MTSRILASCCLLVAFGNLPPTATAGARHGRPRAEAYEESLRSWRQHRLERLTAEDGWLTLIGLFWLQEGDNLVGSQAAAAVRLPVDRAPGLLATINLEGERLALRVAPGVEVHHRGRAVTAIELRSDSEGDPTILEFGDLSLWVIRRGERFAARVRDRSHPARFQFRGIDTFPTAPEWRIEARLEAYRPPRAIPIPTVLGTVDEQPSPGAVVFEVAGRQRRLDALEGAEGRLFLVFADETSGRESYGGGRFLDSEPVQPDGSVVLDFNKAYNPPCAFTDYATCPLPPRQNRLGVRVEAGEKIYQRPH